MGTAKLLQTIASPSFITLIRRGRWKVEDSMAAKWRVLATLPWESVSIFNPNAKLSMRLLLTSFTGMDIKYV